MLLKTIAELKAYVPTINQNMAWATFKPMVDQAERKYIVPLISQALYDALNTAYNAAPQTLTSAQSTLLGYVQRALAYYAFYEILPYLTAAVGDLGVQEIQSSENTAIPARQFILNDLRENAAQSADAFADALLEYLEANANTFPLWRDSSAYTIVSELFINSTAEFEQHLAISNSRRVWLTLRPFVKLAEVEYILPAISQSLFDDLKAKLAAAHTTPLTTPYKTLVSKIQRALAWLTVYKALPWAAIAFNPQGISVSSTGDGIQLKTTADRLRFETAKTEATNNGMSFLRDLKKYLDDHCDDYPLYEFNDFESDTQPAYELPNNEGKRSFMV